MCVGRPYGSLWLRVTITALIMRLFISYYGPKLMKELLVKVETNEAASLPDSGEATVSPA